MLRITLKNNNMHQIEQQSNGQPLSELSRDVSNELDRSLSVRHFSELKEFAPIARMDKGQVAGALVQQAVKATEVMGKPPVTRAIHEFSARMIEDRAGYTLADTQLFWRRFTEGRYGKHFGTPGLMELQDAWEQFEMERAGHFEQEHERRKGGYLGPRIGEEVDMMELYQKAVQEAWEEDQKRRERLEKIRLGHQRRKDETMEFTRCYNRYLEATRARGLSDAQAAAFLPFEQYLLDRRTLRSLLR